MAEIGEPRRYEPDPEYSYSPEEFLRRVRGEPKQAQAAPRRPPAQSSFGRPAAKRGADANPMLGRKVRHPSFGIGTIVGVEGDDERSEEHTSELQSLTNLVCRLLLEKKKTLNKAIQRRAT